MQKLDLAKADKAYYTAKAKPELLTIAAKQYLAIRGKGDPSAPEYAVTIEALYTVAYTLKFMCKEEGNDFVVAKLEGQWWFDEQKYKGIGMDGAPTQVPRSEWEYRLLIRLPEFVTEEQVNEAIAKAFHKKQLTNIRDVTFFTMEEGLCLQMLHVGPFDKEPETLAIMLDFCKKHNLLQNGLHHEIYLSDFRKTAPEKLKTILREPVKRD